MAIIKLTLRDGGSWFFNTDHVTGFGREGGWTKVVLSHGACEVEEQPETIRQLINGGVSSLFEPDQELVTHDG